MMHFVHSLQLPTLVEREDDLRDLVQFFIAEFALAGELVLDEAAVQLVANHPFPDHVEGLKNLIKQLALRNNGDLVSAADVGALLPRH